VRIAVIFHHFGPYHHARLKAAAGYCDVVAIEVAGEGSEYDWKRIETDSCPSITLFPTGDTRRMSTKTISARMDEVLRDARCAAVAIPGWSDNAAMAALDWCRKSDTPAILMSETTASDETRTFAKEQLKKRIVSFYATALVGGTRHVEYLVALGMPRERIFTGYDVVDHDYFRQKAEEARSRAPELRQEYQLPENYFLASARFIAKKNLSGLIRAFAQYRQKSEGRGRKSALWDLVVLGDGPLKSDLCDLISDLQLSGHVHLPGFRQYEELPIYYGLANAFVHASTSEPWGLVINEAIASSLPVLVSNRCGCAPELVRNNGFTFDPLDVNEIGSRLLAMSQLSVAEREKLQMTSAEIAKGFDAKYFGEGLQSAASMAATLPAKRASRLNGALLSMAMRPR